MKTRIEFEGIPTGDGEAPYWAVDRETFGRLCPGEEWPNECFFHEGLFLLTSEWLMAFPHYDWTNRGWYRVTAEWEMGEGGEERQFFSFVPMPDKPVPRDPSAEDEDTP